MSGTEILGYLTEILSGSQSLALGGHEGYIGLLGRVACHGSDGVER